MATYDTLRLIMNCEKLLDSLEQLIYCSDWSERLVRIEDQLGSVSYGERLERLKWTTTIEKWDVATQSYVNPEQFFAILAGGPRILSRNTRLELQIGLPDNRLPQNEQLFFKLLFENNPWHDVWLEQTQCLIGLELPTRGVTTQSNQNVVRPLLALALEILRPFFGFAYRDNNIFVERIIENKIYKAPWQYYWDSIVYGPALSEEVGADRLRALTAFRIIELQGPVFWISSPKGLGDEAFFWHTSTSNIKFGDSSLQKVFQEAVEVHKSTIIRELNLRDSQV